jgi:hypothetical protein
MAPMSEEDLAWFKSTFRPIPRPQLPEDAIEYSLYVFGNGNPATKDSNNNNNNNDDAVTTVRSPLVTDANTDTVLEMRARLQSVQRTASELSGALLKDYIWQREGFGLEITKEDGKTLRKYTTKLLLWMTEMMIEMVLMI